MSNIAVSRNGVSKWGHENRIYNVACIYDVAVGIKTTLLNGRVRFEDVQCRVDSDHQDSNI